jgi:hypothetical protein
MDLWDAFRLFFSSTFLLSKHAITLSSPHFLLLLVLFFGLVSPSPTVFLPLWRSLSLSPLPNVTAEQQPSAIGVPKSVWACLKVFVFFHSLEFLSLTPSPIFSFCALIFA